MCEDCDNKIEFLERVEGIGITLPLGVFYTMFTLLKESLVREDYEMTMKVVDLTLDKIENDTHAIQYEGFE